MKNLKVRMFEVDRDYKELVNWALAIKQTVPHPICLPGVGSVVEDEDGKRYGCGFLYLSTDTPVSVLEWIFLNPECTAREKVEALTHILNSLEAVAKAEDHPVMFAGSASRGITKIFEKLGWTKGISNMDHLIKVIKE